MPLDTDYPRVVYGTTYTYDPAGNRVLQSDSGQLTTYTYDDTNQLLTLQNPAGVTTYTSDADGNRTQQNAPSSVTYYSWDEDDRLIAAEPVAGVVTFTYNADGQRMVKTAPGSTTRFIYDFQRLLEETDGSGATENQYTYVNNGFGDLVSEYDTSDTTYHAYDAQHSTDSLLDDSGSTIDVYKYKAFGLAQAQIGVSQTPFTYVGQQGYYQDAELELYYLGMGGGPPAGRAYDPATGRFLTPDPTGFTAGDANLYRCVGNNPVESDDPAGHEDPELLRWSQKRVKRLKQLETQALSRGDSKNAALAREGYLRQERLHPVGCPHQQLKASGTDSGTPSNSVSGTAKRRAQSGHDVADVEDRDLRKAIARADLANAAYEGVGLTDWARREGWTQVGDQHVLEGTTFRALLFKNTKSGEYVLSFKGTATANDVVNDVEQGESLDAAQYDEAIELTRRLKAKYGPMLSLTGHSLGGGLASAAAIVNNIHAITFNAAGVSAATVERHGAHLAPGVANAFIDAYRVVGEPLSTAQDQPRVLRGLAGFGAGTLVFPPLAVPAGVMAAAAPYGTGNAHWLRGRDTGLLKKHSMDNVIYGLEAELTRRGICIGR
jgi:RHS repeat-associated protein